MERGYVLHHRPFKESSVLVNLLVDGYGRIDAVARLGSGRRSIKSILQPFQPLIFEFTGKSASSTHSASVIASGQSELKNLSHVEAAAPAMPLSGQGLYAGMYLNELLVRTLSIHHGAENLFLTYHQTLVSIAKGFCQSQLCYFEHALLHELGAMPSLLHDASGAPLDPIIFYRWIPEEGFLPTLAGHASTSFLGASLIALDEQHILPEHFRDLKFLMRVMLQPLLGNKPLISRQLFASNVSALRPKVPSR